MPTLTNAKWDALRAQGFTGSISDMTLQWLQSLANPTAELYPNPELAGGADSGPVAGNNPPTAHTFPFLSGNANPIAGGFWEFNPEDTGGVRCTLQTTIADIIPAGVVGEQYRIEITCRKLDAGNYGAAISLANPTGLTVIDSLTTAQFGVVRTLFFVIEITDAVYGGNFRFGTGTTATNGAWLEMGNPTARNLSVPFITAPKSIPDGWQALLALYQQNPQRNTGWYDLLGDEGYTGSLNDRELAFWLAGGILSPPPNPPVLLGAFSTAYSEDFD